MEELSMESMENRVKGGGFALVQGPFRSGKTSHLHHLVRQLKNTNYKCVMYNSSFTIYYKTFINIVVSHLQNGLSEVMLLLTKMLQNGGRCSFPIRI